MKLRSLEEIEQDERLNGPIKPEVVRPPNAVFRVLLAVWYGIGRALLGIAEALMATTKFFFKALIRLLDIGLFFAIVLGIAGCIIFGLVYLFG